jgi:uncharacterized spore protein YtfJ
VATREERPEIAETTVAEKEAMPTVSPDQLLANVLDRFKASAHVNVVFGEPRVFDERTIIPIAAVAYAGGAGGALEQEEDERESAGGGGGYVRVQPVAALEVTSHETRLLPVLDWTRIVTTALTFLGLWMVVRALRGPRR